jgi:hypothetical protein
MKTVLQEFIEYLEGIEKRDNLPNWIITTGKNHLESEKQQIIEAYNKGQKDFVNYDPERHGNECKDGKQYYVSTFGDNHEAGI